jgi:hypothetical protein
LDLPGNVFAHNLFAAGTAILQVRAVTFTQYLLQLLGIGVLTTHPDALLLIQFSTA